MRNALAVIHAGLLVLLVVMLPDLGAQNRVLGLPESFENPVDCEHGKSLQHCNPTSPKSKRKPWLVFSDRDHNTVYKQANTSDPIGEVQFRDVFFVTKESGDWIEIAIADNSVQFRSGTLRLTSKITKVGWIQKENMLLWNTGLVDPKTKIHRKALLLNRADNFEDVVQKVDQGLVPIYRGPTTSQEQDPLHIFEYYFVLKRSGNRNLIAQESKISTRNKDEAIIGWVRNTDYEPWDNRICFEPNFSPAGFQERKENEAFRVRAFKDSDSAVRGARGDIDPDDVFWSNDPVALQVGLAQNNPRRFNGNVVRFPLISSHVRDQVEYFHSGLIGNIHFKMDADGNWTNKPENEFAQFKEWELLLTNMAKNINVFFVIEGTEPTDPYKKEIIRGIKNVHNAISNKQSVQVEYGCLLYRDIPEERINRLIEVQQLAPDVDATIGFIEGSAFRNIIDTDEYTAFYYGLDQALTQAGFNQEELNIIVCIGHFADFRVDAIRAQAAKAANHPAYFDNEAIQEKIIPSLSALKSHLYAIQLTNDGYRTSRGFIGATQNLMLENGKFQFNQVFQDNENEIKKGFNLDGVSLQTIEPAYPNTEHGKLSGAFAPGYSAGPLPGNTLPAGYLAQIVEDIVMGSVEFSEDLADRLKKIISEGKSVADQLKDDHSPSAGELQPPIAAILEQILKKSKKFTADEMMGKKYKLFTEVFFPYTYEKAQNPMLSYVLFMPEEDLENYTNMIEKLRATGVGYPAPEKRRLLLEVYETLVEQFTGDDDIKGMTRDGLIAIIHGLEQGGLKINDPLDHTLEHITNEREISDEMVEKIINRFVEVYENLTSLLPRGGRIHESCYETSENRYYWVPLEDAF